ncbi:MAG: endonuclease VII domain-containing protein [Patescibacteria group bacterium]|nr:endonuclease VII domain-containing protein [Patescibacteria group bacterium]
MPTDLTGTLTRTCTSCGCEKPYTDFYPHRRNDRGRHPIYQDGLYRQATCKACRSLETRASLYGVSVEFLRNLYADQDGLCPICEEELPGAWHVDHDHATGEVRGLLCGRCNTGIGWFNESPEALVRAITYLIGEEAINAY